MLKSKTLWTVLAVVAIATFTFGTAFAEDVAPTATAKPVEKKVEDTTEPTTVEAAVVKTKTETPVLSMLKWIGSQVHAAAGEDCKCCNQAMTKWFDGGADVPLAGMRDQLVADGWTAETTIAFFKQMGAKRAAKGDCSDCAGCDKAKDCAGCDKAKDGAGCDGDACVDCEGCEGCPKSDAKAKGECGGCCGKGAKKDAAPAKVAKP